jgi:O-antigen ligase
MAAFVAVFQWENLIRIEREGGAQASESSVNTRVSYAYVSWKMFLDAPMFGVGYGQFQQTAPAYLSDRTTSLNLEELRSQSNHNMFLAMLTETGLVGFALFVAILVGWGIGAWRVWRNLESPDWIRQQGLLMLGMLGIIFGPMLFFDLTFSPQDQTLTYLLAGLTCGLAAKRPTISLGYTREVTI